MWSQDSSVSALQWLMGTVENGDRLARHSHSMLPALPHKTDHSNPNDRANHLIELVKILAEVLPILPRFHSQIRQPEAPWKRSHKCIKMEAQARHTRNSCRQRDKRPDHRKHTTDQD